MVFGNMPMYLEAALMSLKVAGCAMIGATFFGFIVAEMRLSHSKILRSIAGFYVWLVRGIPLMMILFWLYYATPFNLKITSFQAGVIGMILNSTAFKSEIIRAGLQAVDKKQLEAADAIGMNPIQKMFRVTIPQTVRIIFPSYMSNCVIMLKESSQVSVITVQDLMLVAQRTFNSTYTIPETLGVCSVLYLLMTSGIMLIQFLVEKKLRIRKQRGGRA